MGTWAAPGVQCVCIRDNWKDEMCQMLGICPPSRVPMIGEILTVKEVLPSSFFPDAAVISFVEMDHDFGFTVVNFRPLTTQSDDIALFAHHLDQVSA